MSLTRSSGCDGTVGLLLQHLIKRVPGEFLSRSGEDSTKSARMHLDVDDTQGVRGMTQVRYDRRDAGDGCAGRNGRGGAGQSGRGAG